MSGPARPAAPAPERRTAGEPGAILAIDAAGHGCSVALWRRDAVVAAEARDMAHGQAAELLPMIERVMQAGGLDLRQLDKVAVTVGPGGFTGLRIGLATARGLGLAIGCPVIGISSFQATAAALLAAADAPAARAPGDLLVVLDSRRSEPYLARLAPDLAFRQPPKLLDAAELAAACQAPGLTLACGDGLAGLAAFLPATLPQRAGGGDAVAVARLAADPGQRFHLPPDPVYLRPPDISQPKAPAAVIPAPAIPAPVIPRPAKPSS